MKKSPWVEMVNMTLNKANSSEIAGPAIGLLALTNLLGVTAFLNSAYKPREHRESKNPTAQNEKTPSTSNDNVEDIKHGERNYKTEKTLEEGERKQNTDNHKMQQEDTIYSKESKKIKPNPKIKSEKGKFNKQFKPLVWRFPPK